MPDPPPKSRRFHHLVAAALLVGLFAVTYFLYTRNNDAPLWYHPDEHGKVDQLLDLPSWFDGRLGRNYRHPQLLLEGCELWIACAGTPREKDAFVRAGRNVSAVFGALAAVTLAAAGYLAFGLGGLICCAVTVAMCPSLLVYSHHMKEDSALAFGVGATVLATAVFWRNPIGRIGWLITLPLLGAAAALAASAKYAGVISILIALPALIAPLRRWWQIPIRFLVLVVLFAATMLAINRRVFDDWPLFTERLSGEIDHAFTGHTAVSMDQPNGFIFFVARQETQMHVKLLALAFVVALAWHWRRRGREWWRRDGWQLLAVWFAIACTVALSFGTIPFERYALPVVVLLHFLAGLGAAAIVSLIPEKRWQKIAAWTGAIALIVALQWRPCAELTRGFADDGRQHLRQWLIDHVPPGTRVVSDHYALLREPPDPRSAIGRLPLQLRIASPFDYRRAGMLEHMRRAGVRYVIVCDTSAQRYQLPYSQPEAGQQLIFNRMKSFYEALSREGAVEWSRRPVYPVSPYANPSLRVYRIGPG